MLSYRLNLVAKTKRVTSYEDVDSDVLSLMKMFNLDSTKMRIVRYDGDAIATRYMMEREMDYSCTTPRGNLPGPYYRVKAGFATPKVGEKNERNVAGHGYLKYLLEVVLEMFGFDFFICVSTGEVLINCETLCIEQTEAFILFVMIFCSYNDRMRDAGCTPEQITLDHGKFCTNSMMQWPYARRASERDMQMVTYDMAREVNDIVTDRIDRLLRQNHDDPTRNLNHQGQRFHDIRTNPDNKHVLEAKNLISKFDAVHSSHPEFVSMDRPSTSAFSDNVVCGYARCFTQNCANNLHKLPVLRDMFKRFAETPACEDADSTPWSNSAWRDRNKNSKYDA